MATVDVDVNDMREFFQKMKKAASGDLRRQFEIFLDGIGNEFLRIIQDEIVRRRVVDSRELLNSFEKGNEKNVWKIEDGGMTLEVGSAVNYASYVNDGHWTNKPGQEVRFVPGYWSGDRFIHDPNAKGGMMLRQQWVEGSHYLEGALNIIDRLFPEMLDRKMQEWLDSYFGD